MMVTKGRLPRKLNDANVNFAFAFQIPVHQALCDVPL